MPYLFFKLDSCSYLSFDCDDKYSFIQNIKKILKLSITFLSLFLIQSIHHTFSADSFTFSLSSHFPSLDVSQPLFFLQFFIFFLFPSIAFFLSFFLSFFLILIPTVFAPSFPSPLPTIFLLCFFSNRVIVFFHLQPL